MTLRPISQRAKEPPEETPSTFYQCTLHFTSIPGFSSHRISHHSFNSPIQAMNFNAAISFPSLQCIYAITQQVSILINISQFSVFPESLSNPMHPLIFCCMSNILEHIPSHITALLNLPGGPGYCQGQTQTTEWCIQCPLRLEPWLPFMPHCS